MQPSLQPANNPPSVHAEHPKGNEQRSDDETRSGRGSDLDPKVDDNSWDTAVAIAGSRVMYANFPYTREPRHGRQRVGLSAPDMP